MEKVRVSFLEYRGLMALLFVFAAIAVILFLERSGIQIQYNVLTLDPMPEENLITKEQAMEEQEKECLVLYSSKRPDSMQALETFQAVLTDMRVGYDQADLEEDTPYDFNSYTSVIVLTSNLSDLGNRLTDLNQWVYEGGSALFPLTLQYEPYFFTMESKFGIVESDAGYALVDNIYVTEDFMIGGGRSYEITDGWDSALIVRVEESEETKVYACTGDERQIPLVWESQYGKGKFVLDNFGLYTKEMRGFYCASFSLLHPVTAYPVINASCFYLDDFPSQIPSGNSEYIWRDYGTTIREFYTNIWWPDMMNFSDRYGLKYTGLAIQCYDDHVDGTTTSLPDTRTFLNFGNMLLRKGGEIGYHGYNHQPLCLGNSDYNGYFDYKTWESEAAMKSGMDSLMELCDELFPGVNMSVYVPPSNILSKEGKDFLIRNYPEITSISGIYFDSDEFDLYCVQEFGVDENGIVEQPRITSGCRLDPFMKIAALSELNFHYVNSHFTYPDDALDPERGAEMGWERLSGYFNEYLDWLYSSAPNIRNLTGTEMAAAVQRYSALTLSTEVSEDKVMLEIGNFYDEAQLMIRLNDHVPEEVQGGKLEKLTDTLYLLQADQPSVSITLN